MSGARGGKCQGRSRLAISLRAISLLLSLSLLPQVVLADESAWKTGDAFREQLRLPVSFVWEDNPLRDALHRLGKSQGIAILLDRRVDPGQPMDLEVRDLSVEAALKTVAAEVGIEVSIVDPLVYLGPRPITERLATVAALQRERVRKLPQDARRAWEDAAAAEWEMLTTPRSLLEEWLSRTGTRCDELPSVPHDLWPAISLPPMSLADRWTVVLAGFDLHYQLSPDGASVSLIPWPPTARITQTYRIQDNLAARMQRMGELFPQAEIRREGQRIEVVGRWEEHLMIERLLRGETIEATEWAGAEKRFSLELQNQPLGAILRTLERQLKLTVVMQPGSESKLNDRVSVEVQNASLEQLLHATLDPLQLSFELSGRRLEIRPELPPN